MFRTMWALCALMTLITTATAAPAEQLDLHKVVQEIDDAITTEGLAQTQLSWMQDIRDETIKNDGTPDPQQSQKVLEYAAQMGQAHLRIMDACKRFERHYLPPQDGSEAQEEFKNMQMFCEERLKRDAKFKNKHAMFIVNCKLNIAREDTIHLTPHQQESIFNCKTTLLMMGEGS